MEELDFTVKLIQRSNLTSDTCSFILETLDKKNFDFLPGEAIQVFVQCGDKLIGRFYTPIPITGFPYRFELIIKLYPNGIVTQRINTCWQEGTLIAIRGPIARPHYTANQWQIINLLAGGTGITPVLAILRQAKAIQETTKFNLIFANKSEKDIIAREELESLAKDLPNLSLTFVIQEPSLNWQGSIGFVTEELLQQNFSPASNSCALFFCGPFPMLKALKPALLKLGFDDKNIQLP